MGVLDTVHNIQAGVSRKTKNVSETGNLKKKILYEKERIQEIYAEIGAKFCKDPSGDHSDLLKLVEDVETRKRRISKMNVELNGIKGKKVCPKCHAKFDSDLEFCGKCGTKLTEIPAE